MLKQVEATAVAPLREENNELSLMHFLEERGAKWVKLCYKRGRYHLSYKDQKGHFFWAEAPTTSGLISEVLQLIAHREQKIALVG